MEERLIHCNPEVLHAPGECTFCDEYGADRQQARIAAKTPFTPNESNGWGGNVAQPPGGSLRDFGVTYPRTPGTSVSTVTSLIDRIRARNRKR